MSTAGYLPGEMVRGLALAETTPDRSSLVVQSVGFVGAYRHPGDLNPWTAAILASLLVTWAKFVHCFLLVLLGTPTSSGSDTIAHSPPRWPASLRPS